MSIFGGIGSVVGADIIAYVKLSGADTFNRDLDKINQNATLFAGALNKTLNVALGAGAAAFLASSAAAITFESSFAGVLKTTDGLTDSLGNINAEGVALSQEFRKLALEIPVSVNELNRIGELGGQLGIAKGDLITFTEVIAKLGATTDLSYEAGATAIAQFVNVTKTVVPAGISVQSQIERIASTLVDLGNKSVATESGILEFAQRLAGAGATVGLTQEQILSLGAALSSVGLNAEMGGTAFSRLLLNMKTAVEKGGKSLEVFSKIAGVDFKQAFQEDAAGAITKFVEGMHNISKTGGSVINALGELGINEARMTSALLLASNAGELLNKTFEIGEAAYKSNTALSDEFAKRTATTSAQLILLKNSVVDGAIEFGQTLLPAINSVLGSLNKSPETVKAFISSFGQVTVIAAGLAGLYKVGTGLVTLVTSMNPLVLTLTGIAAGITAILTLVKSNELKKLAKIEGVSDSVKQLITLSEQYKELYETKNRSIEQNELLSETNNKLLEIFRATVGPVQQIGGNIDVLTRRALELKRTKLSEEMYLLGKRIEGLNVQALNKNFQASQTTMIQLNKQYDLMDEELKQVNMMLAVHSVNVEGNTQKVATNEAQVAATKEELKKYHKELTNGVEHYGEILTAQIQLQSAYGAMGYAVTESTQSFIGIGLETVNVKNHSIGLSTATTEVTANIGRLGDSVKLSTGELTHYKEIQKDTRDATNAFNEILNQFIDKTGAAGNVLGVFADYALSAHEETRKLKDGTTETFIAFDTLSLASGLLGIALNALFAEGEKWSWDEYAAEIWGANSAVLDIKENLDALNDELGQYDLIDALELKYIALRIQITWLNATNQENTKTWRDATAEMALVGEQLERLRLAFTFVDQTVQEQSKYITENAIAAWERYAGAIPDDKVNEWLMLLEENTADLEALRDTLVVGSQAWKDNEEAILRNKYVMGLINGEWTNYYEYVRDANLSMEEAAMFFESLGYEGEALDNALLELGYTAYNSGDAVKTLGDNANDATGAIAGLADETERLAPAHYPLQQLATDSENLVYAAENAGEALENMGRSAFSASDAAMAAVSAMRSALGVATGEEPRTPVYDDAGNVIGFSTGGTSGGSSGGGSALPVLSQQLKSSGITTIQSIDEQIEAFQKLQTQVGLNSTEYVQVTNKLIDLKRELIDTRVAVDDFTASWEDQFSTTFSKFDQFNRNAEGSMAALEQLSYFGIGLDETTIDDQVGYAIKSMQEFIGTLDPNSQAYADATAQLNELLSMFTAMGGVLPDIAEELEVTETAFTQAATGSGGGGGAIGAFETWDSMIQGIIDKLASGGTFEEAALNAASVINDLLQFEVDLDTTKADEAIGALISNWAIYLSKLSPDDPNYASAMTSFYNLILQYQKLGVPISFVINGQVNIPALNDTQLRTLYAGYVLHMKDIGQGYYNYTYWLAKFNSGELLLHQGGMIEGLSSGTYGSSREIPFTGLEGEYVLNPNIGRKFGEAALDAFNVSGNPAVLGGGKTSESVAPEINFTPTIEIHNATEQTYATITDKFIHPRIKKNELYTAKSTRFNG